MPFWTYYIRLDIIEELRTKGELKKAYDFETLSERYREFYENITGETFVKGDVSNMQRRIETNVLKYLNCAYRLVYG